MKYFNTYFQVVHGIVSPSLDLTNFKFIKKTKDPVKIINLDDYDIRFRVSSELDFDNKTISYLANLPLSQSERIVYRYKNRVSLKLIDTPNEQLSVDLTIVKTSANPNEISGGDKSFELEIDYSSSNKIDTSIFVDGLEHNKIVFINGKVEKIDFSYEEKEKIEINESFKLEDKLENSNSLVDLNGAFSSKI